MSGRILTNLENLPDTFSSSFLRRLHSIPYRHCAECLVRPSVDTFLNMSTETLEFDGVSVDLNRVGDLVSGFVNLPAAYKRSPVEVCFRAAYGVDTSNASRRPVGGRLSATRKAEAIEEYRRRINAHRGASRGDLAETVAVQFGTSARSIQRWDRAESVQGETGLSDKSSASGLPVISPNDEHLDGAIFTCAWWSFGIANLAIIIERHVAQALLLRRAHPAADILAAIDYYYGWDCDRESFPFKPFSRWDKHDFDKWLHRARQDAELKRVRNEVRDRLRAVKASNTAPVAPDPITRKRDVASRRRTVRSRVRQSRQLAEIGQAANQFRAMQLPNLADALVASAATPDPTTIEESLTAMSDGYRVAILKAAQRDRMSRTEAIATMPIWFERLPSTVRNNIEFRVKAWQRDHPAAKKRNLAALRFDLLLQAMQRERGGAARASARYADRVESAPEKP